MTNAVKAVVMQDKLMILSKDGKLYEYKLGNLTEIQVAGKVIDIEGKEDKFIYQTVNEKTYTLDGTELRGNTFGFGIGYNNTYIIENTGNVYANGDNQYGSLR